MIDEYSRIDAPVIYQHPLAYLLGLEGIALLKAFSGVYDRDFTVARFRDIQMLLDSAEERFRINALRDWIERAPSMQPDAMPNLLDHECAVLIHSFFGTKPYWERGGSQQHS